MSTKTITRSEKDLAIIERHAEALASGQRFDWYANSHASADRMSYRAPMTARMYGRTLEVLGRFAEQGDWHASIAQRVVHRLPLYGTPPQMYAQIGRALAEAVRDGFDDVIGRTGPEAGRPSDHQHATRLDQAILLDLLLVEIAATAGGSDGVTCVGWCTKALVQRERIATWGLPKVTEMLRG